MIEQDKQNGQANREELSASELDTAVTSLVEEALEEARTDRSDDVYLIDIEVEEEDLEPAALRAAATAAAQQVGNIGSVSWSLGKKSVQGAKDALRFTVGLALFARKQTVGLLEALPGYDLAAGFLEEAEAEGKGALGSARTILRPWRRSSRPSDS